MKGVEKVLEREREPREPERNHRSSTTRALAGGASGRLREPMTAATPSPIGKQNVYPLPRQAVAVSMRFYFCTLEVTY